MGRRGSVEYQNPWAINATPRTNVAPPAEYGVDQWRPLPTQGPAPLQIGVYGAVRISQFPGYYNQPQLHQGVEGERSCWYTPTVSTLPTFEQTQRPTNIPGGQRYGANPGAPLGPLSSRKLAARVAAAQVRQSGLQATQWAQGLTGG